MAIITKEGKRIVAYIEAQVALGETIENIQKAIKSRPIDQLEVEAKYTEMAIKAGISRADIEKNLAVFSIDQVKAEIANLVAGPVQTPSVAEEARLAKENLSELEKGSVYVKQEVLGEIRFNSNVSDEPKTLLNDSIHESLNDSVVANASLDVDPELQSNRANSWLSSIYTSVMEFFKSLEEKAFTCINKVYPNEAFPISNLSDDQKAKEQEKDALVKSHPEYKQLISAIQSVQAFARDQNTKMYNYLDYLVDMVINDNVPANERQEYYAKVQGCFNAYGVMPESVYSDAVNVKYHINGTAATCLDGIDYLGEMTKYDILSASTCFKGIFNSTQWCMVKLFDIEKSNFTEFNYTPRGCDDYKGLNHLGCKLMSASCESLKEINSGEAKKYYDEMMPKGEKNVSDILYWYKSEYDCEDNYDKEYCIKEIYSERKEIVEMIICGSIDSQIDISIDQSNDYN